MSCKENGRGGTCEFNLDPIGTPLEGDQVEQEGSKEVQPSRGKRKNPVTSTTAQRSTRLKGQGGQHKEVMKLLADISPPSSSGGKHSGRTRGGKDRV